MDEDLEQENKTNDIDPRLFVLLELGEGEEFDQDEQAFMLGLLEENGLITHDLKLTPVGIIAYEKEIAELEEDNEEDE